MDFTNHHGILLFLRLVLTAVAICNGYKMTKSTKSITWKSFLPIIIVFSLYSGLRWGRGVDYNIYYYGSYTQAMEGNITFDNELVWKSFLWIFTRLKLSWQMFVFMMSTVLIICGCYFMRRYKQYLAWIIPAFVLGCTLAENLMRWYFGFSFVLVGLYFLLDGEKKKYFIWSGIGFLIHFGLIINIVLFYIIFTRFNKKTFNPKICLFIYLFLCFAFSTEWMKILVPVIQNINLGTRYLEYQQNAEFWLTGGAAEGHAVSCGNMVMATVTITLGHKAITQHLKEPHFIILYNLVVIGLFMQPMAKQIELVFRIQELFNFFNKFFYALIFLSYFKCKQLQRTTIFPFVIIAICYTLYHYTIDYVIDLKENQTYFIWDSKGQPAIPYWE